MIALWPHWFRPFWLLILLPLAWLLWKLWHGQKRVGRWQMILPPAFHQALLSDSKGRTSKLPWIALGLAWLLAVAALLGPSWEHVEQPSQEPADPLVVMLELTPEMLADDTPPSRLEQARRKLFDLLQQRADAQTAIIVYAGSAHTLVPLSNDLATSHNLLDAVQPSIMPQSGHRADLAVKKALVLLDRGGLGQGRLLLIGSSLSDQERNGIREALRGKSTPLLILGIGTREGAPVPLEDGDFLKDDQGAILLPRLDSDSLQAFANSVKGQYYRARLDESDLKSLGLLDDPKKLRKQGHILHFDTWADQGYWLLLPLLLLAACAGRRGWLFALPLLFILSPQPGYAFELSDLWLRPDQQGQRLLQQQRPAEAAKRFKDRQWQGLALYEAGDYAAAAQAFAKGNSASDHYNRGNALARGGELEAAIDAYDQALEQQPDLQAALSNKALVQGLLEQKAAEKAPDTPSKPAETSPAPSEKTPPPSSSSHPLPDADQARQPSEQPTEGQPQNNHEPQPTGQPTPGSEPLDDRDSASSKLAGASIDGERRQALEQWLRQIPDNPSELLRRKFWYEQQQHQDTAR